MLISVAIMAPGIIEFMIIERTLNPTLDILQVDEDIKPGMHFKISISKFNIKIFFFTYEMELMPLGKFDNGDFPRWNNTKTDSYSIRWYFRKEKKIGPLHNYPRSRFSSFFSITGWILISNCLDFKRRKKKLIIETRGRK